MKDAMSMTTIFQIVILFILLFTAIMALTINNSNAFGVKDEIVKIIEFKNGIDIDGDSLNDEVKEALTQANYRTTGKCSEDYVGFDRDGNRSKDDKASICIKKVDVTSEIEKFVKEELGDDMVTNNEFLDGVYYSVEVFYQLDIPVVKQVYNFSIKGETKVIYG